MAVKIKHEFCKSGHDLLAAARIITRELTKHGFSDCFAAEREKHFLEMAETHMTTPEEFACRTIALHVDETNKLLNAKKRKAQ